MAKQQKNAKQQTAPRTGKNAVQQKSRLALGKVNFIMMGVCLLMIVLGFALMAGSANDGTTWNAAIFESRRIVVGPLIALLGFVLMAFAIVWRKRDKSAPDQEESTAEQQ